MPPDVVRTRASSTVFENASSRVKPDFAGIFLEGARASAEVLEEVYSGEDKLSEEPTYSVPPC